MVASKKGWDWSPTKKPSFFKMILQLFWKNCMCSFFLHKKFESNNSVVVINTTNARRTQKDTREEPKNNTTRDSQQKQVSPCVTDTMNTETLTDTQR